MFQHQPQRFGETKNGIGRFAPGIREIRDGKKRPVDVIMTVNEQQSHRRLDSGCMMLDDQGMTEEWIVRVQGKEYGPANIDTLREWKAEGRLLGANEARQTNVDFWSTAAEIPGLFDEAVAIASAPRLPQPPLQLQHRSFNQILVQTFRIYREGIAQFIGLTMLVLLPSLCSQLITAFVQPPQGSNIDVRSVIAAGLAFVSFVLSIVMWPVYIAGIQIVTAGVLQAKRSGFVAVLNEAVRFWPRIAALCIFVYGVFFLLMIFGLAIAGMSLVGSSSVLMVLIAMGLLILQVWMFGRFFVNVLFWQQFAVLENAGFIEALRQSRDLARSGREFAWFQRPMWRGALIASLWFVFVSAITLAAQWGTLHHYFNQLMTTQDPQMLLQKMTEAQQGSGFDASSFALSVTQKLLQPLLGIAFVVLYLDSRLELPSRIQPITRPGEHNAVH